MSAALPHAGAGRGRQWHPAHLSVQPGSKASQWGKQCRPAGINLCPAIGKQRSHSNCLKIRNSQIASEGGDGKFIATGVTHAVYLTREKGLGVVCTACINNIVLEIKRIHGL